MNALAEYAPAKVNLGLTLGPTRADGRHELVTVMQPVDLCDRVRLVPAGLGAGADEVHCPGVDGDNLAAAALRAFRERTGWDGAPVRILIEKRIPVAAGMAGGSADAAAALRLAARAAGVRDDALLREIAATLGADVPGQVRPRRYLATGAGEVLRALPDPAPFGILVVRSATGSRRRTSSARRTGWGFRGRGSRWRRAARTSSPRSRRARRSRRATCCSTTWSPRPCRSCPSWRGRSTTFAAPAPTTRSSAGPGPTVVGLFADVERARSAAVSLSGRDPRPVAVEPWYPSLRPGDLS